MFVIPKIRKQCTEITTGCNSANAQNDMTF